LKGRKGERIENAALKKPSRKNKKERFAHGHKLDGTRARGEKWAFEKGEGSQKKKEGKEKQEQRPKAKTGQVKPPRHKGQGEGTPI